MKRVISLFGIILFLFGSKVSAVTLDNDGKALSKPYGDCKVESSFKDAKYYDCYVPYNTKVSEIGGWSTSVIAYTDTTYNYSMKSYYPQRIDSTCFSYVINGYKSVSSGWHGANVSGESTGAQVFTDSKGNKYYGMAIQEFFYASGNEGSNNFPTWNTPNMLGQLVDVILTDGTVIHFVIVDANDSAHTNGGPMEKSLWNVQYTYSSMKNETYKHLFHAACGNCIELAGVSWGAGTSELMSKYNLSEDGNKIAYYRLYNVKIDNSPERSESAGKDVSYSLGDVSITSKQDDSSDSNSVSNSEVLIAENDLKGMPKEKLIKGTAKSISLPNGDDLTAGEKGTIDNVKESVKTDKKDILENKVRVLIAFIGLLMILYVVFLYAAYAFDYANIFVDISLLSVVTFGFLSLKDKSMNSENKFYLKKVHRVAVVFLIVGIILISGSVSNWMYRLIRLVMNKIN